MILLENFALSLYRLPGRVVISAIELALRAKHALNPRTYSRIQRIEQIVSGDQKGAPGRHAVFLTVQRDRLPGFVRRGIEAYGRAGCSVTVVVNGAPSTVLIAALKPIAAQIIIRNNIGRDFGAYKDAVLTLIDQEAAGACSLERLIIANDSVYYFSRGLDEMARRLTENEADFCGVCESNEIRYHLQSFILSFNKPVLSSAAFRDYWRKFLPIGTRQWAISKGEIGLSRVLVHAGFAPDVLYTTHALKARMDLLELDEVVERMALAPLSVRKKLRNETSNQAAPGVVDSGVDVYARWFSGLSVITDEGGARLRDEAPVALEKYLALGDKVYAGAERRARRGNQTLTQKMLEEVQKGSQVHFGGLLFMRELEMPFVKRDMVYRELFHAYEILDLLTTLGVEDVEAVAADLRVKGVASWFRGVKRFLYQHGVI
jgi:hypothetical protein